MFYRTVVQEVLLYGSETWVLSASMERKVEGTHTGFLQQITGNHAGRLGDRTWEMPGAEGVWESAVTQSDMTYIGRRKATVEKWATLSPLVKVCTWETGYEGGGGRRREAWWCLELT